MAGARDPIVDEIKQRLDLADLIGEHVSLKRSGRGWTGLCPFHQEKSPSFHVDADKGFFHCFGCQEGGDAFSFLMKVTGQTFPEALRALGKRVGVEVPEHRRDEGMSRLGEVNAMVAEFFRAALQDEQRGASTRAYLEARGIDEETSERFLLGYAPGEGWADALVRRGVAEADLKKLGLASESRHGRGLYPLFRDRLMFPIRDLSGRVIAFGGRLMGDVPGPKYINSPESPIYHKGRHLYGLDAARPSVREKGQILLVEGYMDAIALSQAGLQNAAGVLGTALTTDQLRLARRFADEIVVCFDGDLAGRRAALRAFPICVDEVDLWPKVVFLPDGEDPDSLVRSGGTEAMEKLIATSGTLIDFYLDDLVGEDVSGADNRMAATARAATQMAEVLAGVTDPIVRDKLVRGASGRLGISEEALIAAARNVWQKKRDSSARPTPSQDAQTVPQRPAAPRGYSSEAEIIELVLCDADAAVRAEATRAWQGFQNAGLAALLERIVERRQSSERFVEAEFFAELPHGMAERVHRRLAAAPDETAMRVEVDAWFAGHAATAAKLDRRELIAQLRAAETRGDQAGVVAALEALRNARALGTKR
ncbi:MAG: DNA primase [Deltaproteobacteria bacterium]